MAADFVPTPGAQLVDAIRAAAIAPSVPALPALGGSALWVPILRPGWASAERFSSALQGDVETSLLSNAYPRAWLWSAPPLQAQYLAVAALRDMAGLETPAILHKMATLGVFFEQPPTSGPRPGDRAYRLGAAGKQKLKRHTAQGRQLWAALNTWPWASYAGDWRADWRIDRRVVDDWNFWRDPRTWTAARWDGPSPRP